MYSGGEGHITLTFFQVEIHFLLTILFKVWKWKGLSLTDETFMYILY